MKLNTVLRLALCSLHSLSLTGILHAGDVVAVVDESPVYLYEVYPHPDVVESLLLDAQVDNFIQHIENMVIEDAVRSYGIVVDNQEVRSKVEEVLEKGGVDENAARRTRSRLLKIADALEQWQHNPDHGNEIYNTLLENEISKAQWELLKNHYYSQNKLEALRSQLPKNFEDMIQETMDATRRQLLREKLFEIITRDVAVDESDVRDYKRQHGVNNDINEPDYNDQIREQALNAKKHAHFNDWLRRQVVTTPVELRDSDLKRALRLKGVSLLHVGEEIDEEKKLPLAPIPVD